MLLLQVLYVHLHKTQFLFFSPYGFRFVVAEYSKKETGGGEGVKIVEETESEEGQYTHKIYYLANKLPFLLQKLLGKENLEMKEESWNSFPYAKTTFTNPKFMGKSFSMVVETMHAEDDGSTENILNLSPEELKTREVIHIDIANDTYKYYRAEEDPTTFRSVKTGRGPLVGDWKANAPVLMTCYKFVTSEFKWWGLQGIVEQMLVDGQKDFMLSFNRKVFCWMDQWYGLSMEEVRNFEKETKEELEQLRRFGKRQGILMLDSDDDSDSDLEVDLHFTESKPDHITDQPFEEVPEAQASNSEMPSFESQSPSEKRIVISSYLYDVFIDYPDQA